MALLGGLGDRLKELGIPFGNAATADSVAAIYAAHLERELAAPNGIVLLDRCGVDALAYVRCLSVNSSQELALYTALSATMCRSLDMVIHLKMEGIFTATNATHESEVLRPCVAREIARLIPTLPSPSISVYAADDKAIGTVMSGLLDILSFRYPAQ